MKTLSSICVPFTLVLLAVFCHNVYPMPADSKPALFSANSPATGSNDATTSLTDSNLSSIKVCLIHCRCGCNDISCCTGCVPCKEESEDANSNTAVGRSYKYGKTSRDIDIQKFPTTTGGTSPQKADVRA